MKYYNFLDQQVIDIFNFILYQNLELIKYNDRILENKKLKFN